MEFHEWVRTLGSIGTALSAIIAVVTYIKATKKSLHAVEAGKARQIRERLQSLDAEIRKLQAEVHQGIALISASAAVAHEIEMRLSSVTSKEEIEEVLSNDQLLLSIAIRGWHKSKASVEVSERITRIELDAAQLTGGLRILNKAVEMLSVVIYDSCSPMVLHKILVADQARLELTSAQPMSRLIDQVTLALQSNASAYYLAAYDKVVKAIHQFVETLVIALCALPDRTLVGVAESLPKMRVEEATKTVSMRHSLRELEGTIDKENKNTLSTLIDNIETYLRKDYMERELHRIRTN